MSHQKCLPTKTSKMISNSQNCQEFAPKLQSKRHYTENTTPQRYPGDKTYKTPEYSDGFHATGTTRPVVNFGLNYTPKPVTQTVLVKELPSKNKIMPDSNLFATQGDHFKKIKDEKKKTQEEMMLQKEIDEVLNLDKWEPAPELTPYQFDVLNKSYGPYSVGYVRADMQKSSSGAGTQNNNSSENNNNNNRKVTANNNHRPNSKAVSRGSERNKQGNNRKNSSLVNSLKLADCKNTQKRNKMVLDNLSRQKKN